MVCAKCGSANEEAAKFCVSCGYALPLKSHAAAQAQAGETVSEEEFYKAVLGPKNQDYYLDRFVAFDDAGKVSPGWNWSAFLVTFYWMLYRKMWMPAAIYFFLPYLLMLLSGIVGAVAGGVFGAFVTLAYFVYLVGVFIAVPMYANALYYKHCQKVIAEVRAKTHDTQRQLGELSGKGGTSKAALIFILIVTCIACIGIVAAVAIPAYQDFNSRARISQALPVGKAATDYVGNYFNQYRTVPRSLVGGDFSASLPPSVAAINVDSQSGIITLTMMGPVPINGKSLKFVPALDGSDQLSWTCMSEDIQDRYLPQECRHAR
jgi:type II secretory pathway pseudopilin PulG